jgi:hypothetical protein
LGQLDYFSDKTPMVYRDIDQIVNGTMIAFAAQ